ncbi:hypothetical protein DAPPUDRAFT_229323 [Daphnia pulex]|uniref:Uncharacterized protein n=1 Tax=Daphnia pulex TaxID=6669 RepID=E9HNA7_DAPPU|nr:hypothetical protein DAPPUDRAFT_229323 [Daphnia pulex]|eukprot:EFX66726.1 hypothetical protein DAPPUDRAFT_229323 [Daphnia pulex]
MARLSVGLMLVLASCWTASSSGAAISLEDKLEQLTNNYNEMKRELTSKIGQLEAQIQQGRAHPTSPVYFYAQRSAPFSTKAVKLPFDTPLLNAGNALDADQWDVHRPTGRHLFLFFHRNGQFPRNDRRLRLAFGFAFLERKCGGIGRSGRGQHGGRSVESLVPAGDPQPGSWRSSLAGNRLRYGRNCSPRRC